MLEYKVGDRVKVRALKSLENEFGFGCISLPSQRFCGRWVTISGILYAWSGIFYKVDNSGIGFKSTAFENYSREEG